MPLSGKKILVVEDEPLLVMAIEDMLHDLGCRDVETASSLRAATELARTVFVDVALLDVNLGGDTSADVARILEDRGLPFLFVTGYAPANLPAEWREAPILRKPFVMEQLGAELVKLLSAQASG